MIGKSIYHNDNYEESLLAVTLFWLFEEKIVWANTKERKWHGLVCVVNNNWWKFFLPSRTHLYTTNNPLFRMSHEPYKHGYFFTNCVDETADRLLEWRLEREHTKQPLCQEISAFLNSFEFFCCVSVVCVYVCLYWNPGDGPKNGRV